MNCRILTTALEDQIIDEAMEILSRRFEKCGDIFKHPDTVKKYLITRLARLEHEVFGIIHLDSLNHVIETQDIFRGSLAFTSVIPRELVKECLKRNSAGVIFYHNHPAGSKEPSPADDSLTKSVMQIFKMLDIRVFDHFIVCGASVYSYVENNRLPNI